jgi:O-antigen/teichoic acid export membrane protein
MKPSWTQPGRRVVQGAVWGFLAEALFPLTGLITTVFLTRRLGPANYGLFTLAATLVTWVEGSLITVFTRATFKFVAEAEDWRPIGTTVMQLHLATSVGVMLLFWLLASPIASLFNEPVLATYLRLFALDIPFFSLARAHQNILIGIGNFNQRALVSAGRWIARLIFIITFVEGGLAVPGAILGSIGASLAECALGRCYVRPSLFGHSHFPARAFLSYAGFLFLSGLSLNLYNKLDLFMLKMLGGTAVQAGIYGAVQNLSVVPSLFAFAFSSLLLSTLSHLLHTGESLMAKKMGREAMRFIIGLLPFAGLVAGVAPEVVNLIFGPDFLPAAPLLAVLIFGALALVMVAVTTAILTAAGKPGWTFALTGPLLPFALLGHLVLIPRLGMIGASLTTAGFAGLDAVATILAVHRCWRILPPGGTFVRSVLICGGAYALAFLWPAPGLLLVLKVLVLGLLIGLAFLLLGEFSADEITLGRSLRPWRAMAERTPGEVR